MTMNVLIVDDEPIICAGLRNTIPWEELDVTIVGEAYDGEEALEIIEEECVDLVLSDVRMPGMDGLELAKRIHEDYPAIRVVILSGYDEFEFAKKALRYGVKDYLLKPVPIDELMQLAGRIKNEMVNEVNLIWRQETRMLLSEFSLMTATKNRVEELNVVNKFPYCLIASEIDEYAATIEPISDVENQSLHLKWSRLIEKTLAKMGINSVSSFINENRLITSCQLSCNQDLTKTMLARIVEDFQGEEIPLVLSFTEPYKSVQQLKAQIEKLNDIMDTYPLHGEKVFYATNSTYIGKNLTPILEIDELTERFQKVMEKNSDSEIIRAVHQLFASFRQNRYLLRDVVQHLQELEGNLCVPLPAKTELIIMAGVNVAKYNSYELIEKLFYEDLIQLMAYRKEVSHSSKYWLVERATKYIEDHYECDLKAAEVADVINVSSNHFSHLFKKETGKHFNDYLHDIRVGKAKTMLIETPYRVHEIAKLVGYREYKYFVHIFKKYTSMTPTEFRNLSEKDEKSS